MLLVERASPGRRFAFAHPALSTEAWLPRTDITLQNTVHFAHSLSLSQMSLLRACSGTLQLSFRSELALSCPHPLVGPACRAELQAAKAKRKSDNRPYWCGGSRFSSEPRGRWFRWRLQRGHGPMAHNFGQGPFEGLGFEVCRVVWTKLL